jgi:hypothetical protein
MTLRIATILAAVALLLGVVSAPAFADAGGGPGSNHGRAGHQPPPPGGGDTPPRFELLISREP